MIIKYGADEALMRISVPLYAARSENTFINITVTENLLGPILENM